MRKVYRNFITKEEAEEAINGFRGKGYFIDKGVKMSGKTTKLGKKILDKLKEDFKFEINKDSYWCIETTSPLGHLWHRDTGTSNHMMWCQVGASLLLKDGDGGGDTYYADDDKETNKVKSDRKLYDLIAHTSDQWHMVEPSKGKRIVFLIFI